MVSSILSTRREMLLLRGAKARSSALALGRSRRREIYLLCSFDGVDEVDGIEGEKMWSDTASFVVLLTNP